MQRKSEHEAAVGEAQAYSRTTALERWSFLSDAAVRSRSQSLPVEFSGEDSERLRCAAALIVLGGDPGVLAKLWRETAHLSWPGSFGQSPWEDASILGHAFDLMESIGRAALVPFYGAKIALYEKALRALEHGGESHETAAAGIQDSEATTQVPPGEPVEMGGPGY